MSLLLASQLLGAAFVVQPGLRAVPYLRAPSPALSEAKGRRDWVFIKGINDYGKEQTYMTLGASKTAQSRFAFDPLGFEDNEALAAIWEKAYLLPLFGPGLLAAAYLVGQLLGVSLSLPSLPEFTLPGGVEIPFMFGIPKLLGFLAGQGMKLTFDIWNFICPLIGLGDARLMYWK